MLTIHSGHLSNDRYFQFGEEFRDRVFEFDPAVLKIKPLFDDWLACFRRVDAALKKIPKSAYTENIMEADGRRNRAFRGLVDTTAATLNHFKPAMKESARRLQIVFDAYGNVAHKALTEKTGAIVNMLQELSSDEFVKIIELLGLGEWVVELAASNAEVYRLTKLREDEAAFKPETSVREARAQTDAVYKAIVRRIDSLMEVEGSDPETMYEPFIRLMNVIIEGYNKKN